MSNPFLAQLNEKNLCTWYILPLLGLNVNSFGSSNLINSYLLQDQPSIGVHVVDRLLCEPIAEQHPCLVQVVPYTHHELYQSSILLIYSIPEAWKRDYERFLKGAYSKMTEIAKDKIRTYSGLRYKVRDEQGVLITDAVLMALERHHPVLVAKWHEMLGPEVDLPEELLSVPGKESFITLG